MLFHVSYTEKLGSGRTALKRFVQWTPPAGFEFKSHVASPIDGGGFALVETASALTLIEATAPFVDVLTFSIVPVVDINEAVPVVLKANAWADSVS